MIIVSNTTPLSQLARINQLSLLQEVFTKIIIPAEVYAELTQGNHPNTAAFLVADWLEVRNVSDPDKIKMLQADTNLDLGECAAIILASELEAQQILIDEKAARKIAISRNLSVVGTVGILLIAKQRGLITNVKTLLDALLIEETYISEQLYRYALTIAGE